MILSVAEANGLIILRVFSGLGEGTMYAALTDLLAAWVPIEERTTLASLAYGGSTVTLKLIHFSITHKHKSNNNNRKKCVHFGSFFSSNLFDRISQHHYHHLLLLND